VTVTSLIENRISEPEVYHTIKISQTLQNYFNAQRRGCNGCPERQSHHSEIFRLALSILNDPADAEDITQDVFISAIHALDSYRGDSAFRTWLFSITVNICRRRWKQRKTRERLIQVLQSIFPLIGAGPVHPEDVLIHRENRAELWKAEWIERKSAFRSPLF
jgi:hypothetical protein